MDTSIKKDSVTDSIFFNVDMLNTPLNKLGTNKNEPIN